MGLVIVVLLLALVFGVLGILVEGLTWLLIVALALLIASYAARYISGTRV
jgi:hypothetical protein